ncbi:MAG: hypothetical protein Q8O79_07260 [Pseudomonadota bacterium]|nr:hypothetical protein [Pseudomonadota bacterium]
MLTNTICTPSSQRPPRTNAWDEVSAIEKRFPRIASELSTLWGSKEIDSYIDGLLLDDRGDRMGFPIDALDELMFLAGIRWHLSHLCGTVIDSTGPEEFNYSGNRAELCGAPSKTWVLI